MSHSPKPLSEDFVQAATEEREKLAALLAGAQEKIHHFEALTAEARDEAESLGRSIRDIEEMLGISSQIAICEIDAELRGERLREVALEVIRDRAGDGEAVHYRTWYEALL